MCGFGESAWLQELRGERIARILALDDPVDVPRIHLMCEMKEDARRWSTGRLGQVCRQIGIEEGFGVEGRGVLQTQPFVAHMGQLMA
jgi:hypothetical protein